MGIMLGFFSTGKSTGGKAVLVFKNIFSDHFFNINRCKNIFTEFYASYLTKLINLPMFIIILSDHVLCVTASLK